MCKCPYLYMRLCELHTLVCRVEECRGGNVTSHGEPCSDNGNDTDVFKSPAVEYFQ